MRRRKERDKRERSTRTRAGGRWRRFISGGAGGEIRQPLVGVGERERQWGGGEEAGEDAAAGAEWCEGNRVVWTR